MYYRVECMNCDKEFVSVCREGKKDFKSETPINVGDFVSISYNYILKVIQRTFVIDENKVDFILLHCRLI